MEELRVPTCPLQKSDVDRILRALNTKLGAWPANAPPHIKRQTHKSFFNYLQKNEWAVLMDERAPVESRMEAIADRAMSIGLL